MPCNVSVRGAFQLTPSARRATGNHLICVILTHISTHALHGEGEPAGGVPRAPPSAFQSAISARRTTGIAVGIGDGEVVSTHALREESDFCLFEIFTQRFQFQSTPSARRATGQAQDPGTRQAISIRNLHMEGDYRQADCLRRGIHDFNPRSPWGERHGSFALFVTSTLFQSTLSARRATASVGVHRVHQLISIHALREEGDLTEPGVPR